MPCNILEYDDGGDDDGGDDGGGDDDGGDDDGGDGDGDGDGGGVRCVGRRGGEGEWGGWGGEVGRLATVGETISSRFFSLRQPAIIFFLGRSLANCGSAARRW